MATSDKVEHSSLLFDEQGSDPATPSSGFWRAYFKAGGLYIVDDAGGVTGPLAAAGSFSSGTSFPGSPSTGDRFYRSDLHMDFYYDGTRWVSLVLFSYRLANEQTNVPVSATSTMARAGTTRNVGTDIWLLDAITTFFVSTGSSALGASHKWVGTLQKQPVNGAGTTILTVNVDSGNSGDWRTDVQALNALLGTSSTYPELVWSVTKTGTPGSIYPLLDVTYRIVAT